MDWFTQNEIFLAWLGSIALILSLLSPLVIIYFIEKLPADYFIQPHRQQRSHIHPLAILKNLLGLVLLLSGLAMLVLPGQGLLTILVGLVVMNFPGKKKAELWLMRRPKVSAAINWLRKKGGKPPFILEKSD